MYLLYDCRILNRPFNSCQLNKSIFLIVPIKINIFEYYNLNILISMVKFIFYCQNNIYFKCTIKINEGTIKYHFEKLLILIINTFEIVFPFFFLVKKTIIFGWVAK